MKKCLWFTTYIILVSLLSGCMSLKAVQKYATYSQATLENVQPVAKDFYESCTRANSFKPINSHSGCKTEQEASKAILMISNVLKKYTVSLGALAADEIINYDTNIDEMTTELKVLKVNGLEDAKVDAVGSLAKLIAKTATSSYRERRVSNFIIESDESINIVTESLADIIEKNYSNAIDLEISAWKDRYQIVEEVVRNESPLEWDAYSKAQWKDRAELDAKLNAVKDLSESIRKIGSTHSKLKKDAKNLTGKEVAALIRSFVEETKPVIKQLQDAF